MMEYSVGDYIKDKDGNIFFVIALFSIIDYCSENFKCLLVLDYSLIITSRNIIKLSNDNYRTPCREFRLYSLGRYSKYVPCMLGDDFSLADKEESRELRDQISCLLDNHKKRLVEEVEDLLSVVIKENRKQGIYTTFLEKKFGRFVKYPPFRKIIVHLINEYLNPDKHRKLANL